MTAKRNAMGWEMAMKRIGELEIIDLLGIFFVNYPCEDMLWRPWKGLV